MSITAKPAHWRLGVDYPTWGDNEIYFSMIKDYLLDGETPVDAYNRVCKSVSKEQNKPEFEKIYFDLIWDNILGLSSPVLSNSGTDRGLPIACFGVDVQDDTEDIGAKYDEIIQLAKGGGGIGINFDSLRHMGAPIKNNGTSDGTRPFIKIADVIITHIKQGKTRAGAGSANQNVRHKDFFPSFLDMCDTVGDVDMQIRKLKQTAVIDDEFMLEVEKLNTEETAQFMAVVRKRIETGMPFILYKGNANKANPPMYKYHDLSVKMTNICTEIMLHSDRTHTFVCCLASLNATKQHLFATREAVKYSIYFLDGVMSEFIRKAKGKHGYENSVRFAEKSRALGLGLYGWHSFLIEQDLPYISISSNYHAKRIFEHMKVEAFKASQELAVMFGEPEWCKGFGVRNTHQMAIAPTTSNSMLHGSFSPNTEPYTSVYWNEWASKGSFTRKNPYFVKLLTKLGRNTHDVWSDISAHDGSIQHLDFISDEDKDVYLTAFEINQMEMLKQKGIMQTYVDQGISTNIFLPKGTSPNYAFKLHYQAWKLGLKTLYYCHGQSSVSADRVSKNENSDCGACDG